MKRSTTPHTQRALWWMAIIAGLLVVSLTLQASTSTSPGRQAWDKDDGPRPSEVVSTMKFVVHEVGTNRTLVLVDEDQERPHRIQLSENIPLTAKSKKEFQGRKKLEFGDLAVGQRVKVTFKSESGEIVRVKILESAQSS